MIGKLQTVKREELETVKREELETVKREERKEKSYKQLREKREKRIVRTHKTWDIRLMIIKQGQKTRTKDKDKKINKRLRRERT